MRLLQSALLDWASVPGRKTSTFAESSGAAASSKAVSVYLLDFKCSRFSGCFITFSVELPGQRFDFSVKHQEKIPTWSSLSNVKAFTDLSPLDKPDCQVEAFTFSHTPGGSTDAKFAQSASPHWQTNLLSYQASTGRSMR